MSDIEQRIQVEFSASAVAAAAGNTDAADRRWRAYVGLLEVKMGRTGSPEHLTPAPKRDAGQPK